jgi:hypothetical protein
MTVALMHRRRAVVRPVQTRPPYGDHLGDRAPILRAIPVERVACILVPMLLRRQPKGPAPISRRLSECQMTTPPNELLLAQLPGK